MAAAAAERTLMSPTSDEVIAVRIVPNEPPMTTWQFIGLYVVGAALGWILTEITDRYERRRASAALTAAFAWPKTCTGCDTCGAKPCAGGCRRYLGGGGKPRHGCEDDRACRARFVEQRAKGER